MNSALNKHGPAPAALAGRIVLRGAWGLFQAPKSGAAGTKGLGAGGALCGPLASPAPSLQLPRAWAVPHPALLMLPVALRFRGYAGLTEATFLVLGGQGLAWLCLGIGDPAVQGAAFRKLSSQLTPVPGESTLRHGGQGPPEEHRAVMVGSC